MKQPISVSDSVSIIIKSTNYHVAIYETISGKYECTFVDERACNEQGMKGFIDLFTSSQQHTILELFQEFYKWYSESEWYNRDDNRCIKSAIENFILKADKD